MTACPRCRERLGHLDRPIADGHSVSVDSCNVCGGIWLDAEAIQGALPALVPHVRGGLLDGAAGFLPCPADRTLLVSFRLETLTLDACPKCAGLWIDGGERDAVQGVHDAAAADKHTEASEGGYRIGRPTPQPLTDIATCVACDQELLRRHMVSTNRGLTCRPCLRAAMPTVEATSRLDRLLRFLRLRQR